MTIYIEMFSMECSPVTKTASLEQQKLITYKTHLYFFRQPLSPRDFLLEKSHIFYYTNFKTRSIYVDLDVEQLQHAYY